MADFYTNQAADNFRLAKSRTLVTPTDGTYSLLRISKYTFVLEVFLLITTAYAGAGAPIITIGFTGNGESADTDAFLTNAEADPLIVGLKTSKGGSALCADGKYFSAAGGAITLTCDDDACATVFTGHVFVVFSVVH